MSHKHIAVIPGDGIGVEITSVAVAVLKAAAAAEGIVIETAEYLAGGAAIDAVGHPLPAETVEAAKKADAVLLGAVGGPKWDQVDPTLRPEQAILGLRKELGLFANLRPVRISSTLTAYSTFKPEVVDGVDILILRELTGGIYFGEKKEAHLVDGIEQAWDTELYTRPEIERIIRMAFDAARQRQGKVLSVDKANVLAASRLWRKVATELAAANPDVQLEHMYVDNAAMQLILGPKKIDVLVTSNLFGDILSDEAAVLGGSIGMLPSASLGTGTALYEPIHGSAPDIAGQNIANPLGTILAAAMLLRHSLQCDGGARKIEEAVDRVLAKGYRTADMVKEGLTRVTTQEMGELVLRELATL